MLDAAVVVGVYERESKMVVDSRFGMNLHVGFHVNTLCNTMIRLDRR